jgi:hypothetical protein
MTPLLPYYRKRILIAAGFGSCLESMWDSGSWGSFLVCG